MVGWHHQLNGHECEQTQGDSDGERSVECCSSWDGKQSDMTQLLNNNRGNIGNVSALIPKNKDSTY